MKTRTLSISFLLLSLILSSCQRNKVTQPESETNQLPTWAAQKYSFLNKVTDAKANKLASNPALGKVEIDKLETIPPKTSKLRFRWDGCFRPLGICFTVPIGVDDPGDGDDGDEVEILV